LKQLEQHPESQRQIVAADRLLISKCDLSSSDEKDLLEQAVRALNPHAQLVAVRRGVADIEALLAPGGVYGRAGLDTNLKSWLGSQVTPPDASGLFGNLQASDGSMGSGTDSSDQYLGSVHRSRKHSVQPHSFVVTFDWPVAWLGFSLAMGRILRNHGAGLLRIKGLMRVAGDETHPRVVQCVQDIAYPPVRLQSWPMDGAFEDGCGRLVFIARKSDKDFERAIRSTLNEQETDAAALRACATDWSMPTRCWMSQRIPIQVSSGMAHAAWDIQKRRFRSLSSA
jgi:G3E family GTPase